MEFKPRETLTEQVAKHIERLIVFGKLKSGERIYEGPMAKELSVSHGSVREALLLLEKRHLVRSVARKGTFVTELDAPFVKGLYETLLLYLSHTGRKLAQQWQDSDIERLESLYAEMSEKLQKGQLMEFLDLGIEYTQASLAYANNYFVETAIRDLWPSAERCAYVALRQGNKVILDSLQHMRNSIDIIKQRDDEALVKLLEDYANNQCKQVLECLGYE